LSPKTRVTLAELQLIHLKESVHYARDQSAYWLQREKDLWQQIKAEKEKRDSAFTELEEGQAFG
jgi:hypothetical protein